MDCDTKKYQDWVKCWIEMDFLTSTGLEILIVEDVQMGMYLTYLEEKSVRWARDNL